MELFGICLSIAVSFALSFAYIKIIGVVIKALPRTAVPLNILSALVLAAFGIESYFVLHPDVARAAGLFGPAFDFAHLFVFLLGVPALANILVATIIRPSGGALPGAEFFLALPCTFFAFFLVMLSSSGWPPLACEVVDGAEVVGEYHWNLGHDIETDLLLKQDGTFDETVKYNTTWAGRGNSPTEKVLLYWDETYRNSGDWSLTQGKTGSEVLVSHSMIDPFGQPPIYFDHRLKACKRDGGVFLQWDSPDSSRAVDFLSKVNQ